MSTVCLYSPDLWGGRVIVSQEYYLTKRKKCRRVKTLLKIYIFFSLKVTQVNLSEMFIHIASCYPYGDLEVMCCLVWGFITLPLKAKQITALIADVKWTDWSLAQIPDKREELDNIWIHYTEKKLSEGFESTGKRLISTKNEQAA